MTAQQVDIRILEAQLGAQFYMFSLVYCLMSVFLHSFSSSLSSSSSDFIEPAPLSLLHYSSTCINFYSSSNTNVATFWSICVLVAQIIRAKVKQYKWSRGKQK